MTRLGEFLVQFPLPPNLSCAVIKAASLDCEDLLLPITAMLSVENVFIRPGRQPLTPEQPRVGGDFCLDRAVSGSGLAAHTASSGHPSYSFPLQGFLLSSFLC